MILRWVKKDEGDESTMKAKSRISLVFLLCFASTAGRSAQDNDGRCAIWIDVYSGEPLRYEEMLDDLAGVRVIYIGERHTLKRHHRLQRRIFEDLAERGKSLALGLEQMYASEQAAFDRYCRGEIDFDKLTELTSWAKRWSNYEDYRPVIESARKRGAPVLALNARSETVREVYRKGIDGLDAKTRSEIPSDLLLDDPPYERLLNLELMVHMSTTPERLRPMVHAQIVRDETMAHSIASFLQSPEGRGRTAVVLCGAGHVSYGFGLPSRVRRRMPDIEDRIVILSESGDVELSPEEKAMARDITITHQQLREFQVPIADYLHAFELKPAEDSPEAPDKQKSD